MKRKEISRLIASTLTATVALNSYSGNIRVVSASTKIDASIEESEEDDDSSEKDDAKRVEELSGVSTEQMQSDFEDFVNKSDEEVVDDSTDKLSEEESLKGISAEVSEGKTSSAPNNGIETLAGFDFIGDFSFDGENAGCIVMNSGFSTQLIVEYSFDGGKVWKEFTGLRYKLEDEELASITAEHGIIIRAKQQPIMCKTINIQAPSAPTSSTVYGNDLEDRLIGATDYLEYRFSEDEEWQDYTEETRFTGDKTVEVRYKLHGTSMASPSSKYTFKASTDTAERTYVPLSDVSLHEFCSEENNGYSYAKNMLDGNINTFWHNNWAGESDLYYSVQFNEIKFLSSIEYLPPTGSNGRLKSGEILISYDGTNWDSAGTFKISSNDTNLKKINLDTPMPARYVKIKATETWGNSDSNNNKFFSGRMLNFYEDTTKKGQTDPFIKYSTTKETKNYVTATLVLMEGQTTTESKTYKFLNNGTHEFNYFDSEGNPKTITANVENIVRDENANSVYLTEIDYEMQSYAGWNGIRYNLSPSGGTIGLMIDGLNTKFSKGIGAHADSELVYDIEAFSDKYTTFSTYVGVDSSRGSNGSVKFLAYVSNDGSDWENVYESSVLSGDSPAEYLSVNIKGWKYLKLVADDQGNSAEDHAVYGSPRLVKEGYDINCEKVEGLLQVSEYDAQIKELHTVGTEMSSEVRRLVMLREFVNRFGYSNLKQYGEENLTNKRAIEYILKNDDVLSLFLEAGTLDFGTGANSVKAWCSIYAKHETDLMDLMHRKLMIATTVALSRNIQSYMSSWGGGYRYSDPLTRYELMKQLYDDGRFLNYNQFNSLSMELIRAVVDARLGDDEILWLRNYTELRYPTSTSNRFNPYNFIAYISPNYGGADLRDPAKYEQWDEKYKLSENGVKDYGATNMPKIWMSVERGSICWGISGFGSATNEVHGIPSINIYQPQHEAYLVYSEDSNGNGLWSIGNNVFGWESSYTRWAGFASTFSRMLLGWGNKSYISDVKNNASYVLLGQAALNDYENYKEASMYNYLAKVYNDDKNKQIDIYNQALDIQSFNLDSIEGLVNAYKALGDVSSAEWTELARKIIKEYTYYPVAMIDLLNLIKGYITDDLDIAEIDMLRTSALNKAANATSAVSLQPDACKAVAKSYLGTQSTYLATFSFDGADAGKIVLNEKYREYTVRVRYSLDGGENYKETDDQVIQLSEEELNSITSSNDIIVGLVGTQETYTIDIKDGITITNDLLYKSDLENRFIGDLSGLQFSTDECETWCEYSSDTRFPGNVKVYVRYKPKGVYLGSPVASYTFTADSNTDKRTYISIDHLTLAGFSNEQNNTSSAAKNMIDAKDNTGWHTKYSYTTVDKFYTVKLDEIKFISAVEYLPGGVNGRMKDVEVYTSYDGEKWTLAATVDGLANNNNLKKIEFANSIPARYIKVVAKNTYGNSTGETNMYFSGMAFNYYEDTTKVYNGEPIVIYSTDSDTNHYVDAKLILAEGCEATELTHRFTDNGSYEFHYTKDGEEKTITATVNNIVRDLSLTSVYLSDLNYEDSSFSGWNGVRKDLAPSGSKINVKVSGTNKQFDKGIGAHADSEVIYDLSMFTDYYDKFQAYVGIDRASAGGSASFKVLASKNGDTWDELATTGVLSKNDDSVFVNVDVEGYSYLKLVADGGGDTGNDHAVYADAKLVRTKASVHYTNDSETLVTAHLLLPDGFEATGELTHEFTVNGKHTFEYMDADSQVQTIEAVVDWMESTTSEKDENIDSGFGIDSNGDDKDIADGEFDGDDGFNVEPPVVDEDDSSTGDGEDSENPGTGEGDSSNGNPSDSESSVTEDSTTSEKDENIDDGYLVEDTRNFEVEFNYDSLTNQDVTATLVGLADTDKVTSLCGNTWLFKTNGKHTFIVEDINGKVFEIPVEVTWIDKEEVTATISFDYSKAEEGIVIAKVTGFNKEGVVVTNTANNVDYFEFKGNGSFTFEFFDKAGNKGSATANVEWFDFEDLNTFVTYENLANGEVVIPSEDEEVKPDSVIATIDLDPEKFEIINNEGSNQVKFVKNGVFAFRARMIETGEEFDILVQVDWLAEDAAEGESPVELPEGTLPDENPSEGDSDDEGQTPVVPPVEDSTTSEKDPNIDAGFGVDSTDDKDVANGEFDGDLGFGVEPPVVDDSEDDSNGDSEGDNTPVEDPSTSEKDENIDESFGIDKVEDPSTSDKDENLDPDFGIDKEEDPDVSEDDPNVDDGFGIDKEEDSDVSDKDENIDPDFGVEHPVVDDDSESGSDDGQIPTIPPVTDPDEGDTSEDETPVTPPVTPPVTNPDNGNNNNGGNTNTGGSGNGGSGSGGNGSTGGNGDGDDPNNGNSSDGTTSEKDPSIDPDFGIDKEEDSSTSEKDENIDEGFGIDKEEDSSTSEKDEIIDDGFLIEDEVDSDVEDGTTDSSNGSIGNSNNHNNSNGNSKPNINAILNSNKNNSNKRNPIADLNSLGINVSYSDTVQVPNISNNIINEGNKVVESNSTENNYKETHSESNSKKSKESKDSKGFIAKVVIAIEDIFVGTANAIATATNTFTTASFGIFEFIRKFFGIGK